MHKRTYDRLIPHAPEFREAYHSLMCKAADDGRLTSDTKQRLGAKDNNILLPVFSDDDAEVATNICGKWADGRKVSWCALPCEYRPSDILFQVGYVGCTLDDSVTGKFGVDDVMKIMLKK